MGSARRVDAEEIEAGMKVFLFHPYTGYRTLPDRVEKIADNRVYFETGQRRRLSIKGERQWYVLDGEGGGIE